MAHAGVEVDTAAFWRDGYSLIKGVFGADEVARLREGALASTAAHKGDLLSNPALRDALLDDRLLTIAAKILGAPPVYFGDSACVIGEQSHGWHKDNADRSDERAPDWQGPYTLIRFGLYLQDHSHHSGGLNVRHQSHLAVATDVGKTVYLRTRVGDLVVWNLRTTHSGNGVLLRFLPWLALDPGHRRGRLSSRLIADRGPERVALFASMGVDDRHLSRYLTYLKTREYMVEIWNHSPYSEEVWDAVRGKRITVLDMREQTKGEIGLGKQKGWAPIAY